jgi:transcriptional regulator with XRE-family HTH domain
MQERAGQRVIRRKPKQLGPRTTGARYRDRQRSKTRPEDTHAWQQSHPSDNRPTNGTQTDDVAASPAPSSPTPAVARARFARFVKAALDAARDRGMTDKDIQQATGIGPSTFHRWRRGEGRELPELEKVRAFCDGLGVSVTGAMTALGLNPAARDNPEPEPPLPPEVRKILRALADPNVAEADKLVLREFLKMAAERAERGGRS